VKIFKYPLELVRVQEIFLPEGATILSVKSQEQNKLSLWAAVNSDVLAETEKHTILVLVTGSEIPESYGQLQLLSTVLDGVFVWHVFLAIKEDVGVDLQ